MAKTNITKYFKNKLVSITIKNVRTRGNFNMSFVGFLLDEDDEYFYLGEDEKGGVEAAIPKTENAGITLISENDLMNEIEIPDDQDVQ